MEQVTSAESQIPLNNITWTAVNTTGTQAYPMYQNEVLATPPPESNGFTLSYPYPSWLDYGISANQATSSMTLTTMANTPSFVHTDCYISGSSLEESPLSSPGSSVDCSQTMHERYMPDELTYMHSQLPITTHTRPHSPLCDHAYGVATSTPSVQANSIIPTGYDYMMAGYSQNMVHMENKERLNLGPQVPKGVKMPQSKYYDNVQSKVATESMLILVITVVFLFL